MKEGERKGDGSKGRRKKTGKDLGREKTEGLKRRDVKRKIEGRRDKV